MKFKYWARNKDGKSQNGIIEASSREAALEVLKSSQLFVTGLEETESVPFWAKDVKLFERITAVDLVMFSRQLSVMFSSGVPLVEALTSLGSQSNKKKFKDKILKLAENIQGGTSLSKSLSDFPEVFSDFYVSVVRSGEVSGTLGKSLVYLANHLERQNNLRSKLQGAMVYPALVVTVMLGVFVLITVFIIPQLVGILEGSEVKPPAVTMAAIALSNFMRNYWWIILLFLAGLGVSLLFYVKTEKGKRNFDKVYLSIPWVGLFLKKIYLARFAENLSTLVTGGLPISQALEVAGRIVGNSIYQEVIAEARDKVIKGESITNVFSQYPEIFTSLFCQMSSTGEKTGNLDKTLMTVANFYEEEIGRIADNMTSIIEPVMIVVLGIMVGLLMGAVVIPLYQISSAGI